MTVFHNTVWSSVELALELALPLVTSVLVARALGPTHLGAYAYILWISQMAVAVGAFGVPSAVSRYLPEALAKRQVSVAWALVRAAFRFQLLATTAIVVGGLALIAGFSRPEDRLFSSIAVVSILPAGILGIATAIHSSFEDVGSNVVPSIAGSLTNVSIVLATLLFGWDLPGLAAALLLGRTVDTGLRWYLVARNTPAFLAQRELAIVATDRRAPLPPALRQELVSFCGQSSVLLVLQLVVWNRSEMFFLKRFCEIPQVAFFSLAFSFGGIPGQLARPFLNAAVTTLFAQQGQGEAWLQRFSAVMWRYTALLVWPAAFGLAAIGGPLVQVLYGPRYLPAAPALVLAALLSGLPRLVESPTRLVTVLGGQGRLVWWGLASAVVTLALDIVLVRAFCATGGAVANGLGQAIATVGVCAIASRSFGFRIDWSFNLRVVAAAGATAAAVLLFARSAPAIGALIVGPLLGLLIYGAAVRWLRLLNAQDAERLSTVVRALPQPARTPLRLVAAWCGAPIH